ncbi:MAG: translocation/assembly module TamB domain-containing protein, partial [Verrucomicrobia bacterium]|nr:translocation/assembly module TamB domain-containing protein [Verrucomicrobiota bacterium]
SKINAPWAQAGVAGSLPIAANWADSVAAALVLRTGPVQYQTVRVPEVRMNARLLNHSGSSNDSQPSVTMAADVLAQPSSIGILVKVPIPKPGTTPDLHTIQAAMKMDVQSINDFLVGPTVAGTLSAKGDITVKNLQPDGQITVIGNSLNYRKLVAQSADLEFRFLPDQIEISKGVIVLDPANSIQLGGAIRLQDPYSYHFNAKADFANLGVLNPFASNFIPDAGIAGQLGIEAEANGAVKSALPSGQVSVTGSKIGLHGLFIQQLNLVASTAKGDVDLSQLKILFNQNNQIEMTGAGKITEKLPYFGRASVRLNDLAYFNQVLRGFHQDLALGGKLTVDWGGSRESGTSVGQLDLNAAEVTVKQVQHINAKISGTYQALDANLHTVQVTSPLGNVGMSLHVNPKTLDIEDLTLKTHDQQLTGHATIPLDFQSGSKIPVAIGQPINIDLHTQKVSLASFQGSKPAVEGNGTFSMQASGDTTNPNVIVNLAIADIRSSAARTFAAASMNTTVKLENKLLTLDGSVKQADIQPLNISGKVAFDFPQFVKTGVLAETTPIQASIKWPDTDLRFLRRLIHEIRVIEGHAGISVDAAGTLAKPTVQGEVHANIPLARAKTDVVPPVSDFVAQINFRENRIELAQLRGNAAGGPFTVGGTIDLTKGTDPSFDISVHGNQILLTRSDNIIVRCNPDLSIKGPLSAGSIEGRVMITNSRFFQDIDILPLNLPGQPAPQPPGQPPNASIQTPPFNNWRFNITVQTADPFRIQSNLARGSVVINLQVGGTGQKPEVAGNVKISQLTASLPFSHMDISNSYINFNPGGNPLDPQLNIMGTSTVRDYDITMQIYGPASNFKILFQSSPPLSQGDIATLLATGSTSSEFVQDPSLLAGRAAFLLIRQVYGKIFKGGRASQPEQQLLDRLEVDIIPGQRVGSQDVSARFSVTRSWQVVAEFGSIGNVSGQLRYLIRFR